MAARKKLLSTKGKGWDGAVTRRCPDGGKGPSTNEPKRGASKNATPSVARKGQKHHHRSGGVMEEGSLPAAKKTDEEGENGEPPCSPKHG